jgi:hypothetical protein
MPAVSKVFLCFAQVFYFSHLLLLSSAYFALHAKRISKAPANNTSVS